MEKPITLIIDDLRRELAEAIERSRLPAVVIEPYLRQLYQQVAEIAIQQTAKDREDWKGEETEDV